MAMTIPIPTVSLPVGVQEFGPAPIVDNLISAAVTIDRTVAGGLNSLPATAILAADVLISHDGGISFEHAAGITAVGGVFPNPKGGSYLASTLRVGFGSGIGRQIKARLTVSGRPIAVAGSIVVS